MFKIVVAHSNNLVISRNDKLPWSIKEDIDNLKKIITDHDILVGKNTLKDIVKYNIVNNVNDIYIISSSLSKIENNIVIDRTTNEKMKINNNFHIYKNINTLLCDLKDKSVCVLGGEHIYDYFVNNIEIDHELYITEVHYNIEDGDVFFPEYRHNINTLYVETNRWNNENFSFVIYKLKS